MDRKIRFPSTFLMASLTPSFNKFELRTPCLAPTLQWGQLKELMFSTTPMMLMFTFLQKLISLRTSSMATSEGVVIMREASRGLCEEVKGEYEDECDSRVKYERRRTSEQPKMNVSVKVKGRVAESASFNSNIIHKLGI